MNGSVRVGKPQKVKKAREGLVRMAYIDDRTSRPQHVYVELLKTHISGKIKHTMPRLKQRLKLLRDDGRNVKNVITFRQVRTERTVSKS